MARTVSIDSGPLRYDLSVRIGPHTLQAAELSDIGGRDSGPHSLEFVDGRLGGVHKHHCANRDRQLRPNSDAASERRTSRICSRRELLPARSEPHGFSDRWDRQFGDWDKLG